MILTSVGVARIVSAAMSQGSLGTRRGERKAMQEIIEHPPRDAHRGRTTSRRTCLRWALLAGPALALSACGGAATVTATTTAAAVTTATGTPSSATVRATTASAVAATDTASVAASAAT